MTTGIEWTDQTWNPVTGCDRTSPGCDNCYALTLAKRLKAMGNPRYQDDGNSRTSGPGFAVTLHHDKLAEPHRWRKPRTVFVNSMSDLFHPAVPDEFIFKVFATMSRSPRHTYQVLTKRSKRMRDYLTATCREPSWELDNVWLGVSVETAAYKFRIDHLRHTPASVRFLSLEPLLGPLGDLDLTGIDWVILGGESGHHSRPMNPDWAREIRDQCAEQDVPFFFKQWGNWEPTAGIPTRRTTQVVPYTGHGRDPGPPYRHMQRHNTPKFDGYNMLDGRTHLATPATTERV